MHGVHLDRLTGAYRCHPGENGVYLSGLDGRDGLIALVEREGLDGLDERDGLDGQVGVFRDSLFQDGVVLMLD
ncbi:MAG TPA: hypothetical protein V6C72_19075 [Chroococcales cyanobacterium]